ncbi:DMT family transporter [uncultured Algimonas sp.]|uniref:DMT family transporter n=1 Tax=uncultured Algimonas sp. TaxID=1547920 RepID=UPI00261F9A2B|nr:DMT family transporter [uncultured Algimonas sp.]
MTARATILLTGFALFAFAGNSVLARAALIDGMIGVVPFTAIRILSGAVVLAALVGGASGLRSGSWGGAASLLGYAALFTLAYLKLDTGMGALLLFASVQITMIGWGARSGERLGRIAGVGVLLAFGGLVGLLLPGQARPDILSALLMIASGVCWGVYSLLGRGPGRALHVTAGNFMRASLLGAPLVGLALYTGSDTSLTATGVGLAVLSGAVTSGLGYAVWYRALQGLTASRAGIVQLAVPPMAALGGVVLLSEPLTMRLVAASAIILAGIALAIVGRPHSNSK